MPTSREDRITCSIVLSSEWVLRDFTEKLSEIIFSGDLLKMTYRVFLDVLVGKRTFLNATLKAATNMFKGTFHFSKISPVLKYV